MCGRYTSATPPTMLAEHFKVESLRADDLGENYNVAPTSRVYAVAQHEHQRTLGTFRWGLVPAWAKDPSIGSKMINARAETVATKSSFRHAFKRKRCIIPADGFYEWQVIAGRDDSARKVVKQPVWIHRVDGQPLAFAGLWELWRPRTTAPQEDQQSEEDAETPEPLRTCTIITTTANGRLAPVHNRMPVILPESAWQMWLDTGFDDLEVLQGLLVPAANEIVTFHPVSTAVNSVRNRGPELIRPSTLGTEPGDMAEVLGRDDEAGFRLAGVTVAEGERDLGDAQTR